MGVAFELVALGLVGSPVGAAGFSRGPGRRGGERIDDLARELAALGPGPAAPVEQRSRAAAAARTPIVPSARDVPRPARRAFPHPGREPGADRSHQHRPKICRHGALDSWFNRDVRRISLGQQLVGRRDECCGAVFGWAAGSASMMRRVPPLGQAWPPAGGRLYTSAFARTRTTSCPREVSALLMAPSPLRGVLAGAWRAADGPRSRGRRLHDPLLLSTGRTRLALFLYLALLRRRAVIDRRKQWPETAPIARRHRAAVSL